MAQQKTTTFADLAPKPWVQEVYEDDQIRPPSGLLNISAADMSSADIPVERYFSYEWHRQEVEHVWKKTWQVAPLVDRFPPDGDNPERSIYEIWMLYPKSDEGTHPPTMKDRCLGPDERWASVEELGSYGPVIDQHTRHS